MTDDLAFDAEPLNKHDTERTTFRASTMMRQSYRVSFAGKHGLTLSTGVLSVISTIIGGGILSIPYSFISFGIPLGIVMNLLATVMVTGSVLIYLRVKDLIPDQPESLYEIGYMVLGRSAIFYVAVIQFINSFGLMLVYFIVFGDTSGQLFANLFNDGLIDQWMYQRWFYVVTLGVPLTLVILKKELAELDWLAWVLFGSLGIFILMLCWLLFVDQSFRMQRAGLSGDIWFPDHGIGRLISAVSIILVAYGYQFNIYPIYGSLQEKTNEQYVKINNYGLLICCAIYITVGIVSIAMFGPNVSSVILEDIGTATNSNGGAFWESYVIQLSFMILLVCHMPFIFFSGKEAMLIIIDEIDRKSISNALWHKLYATGKNFEQAQDRQNALPPAPELPVPGEDIAFEVAVKKQGSTDDRKSVLESAKSRVSMLTAAEANRLAYKDMKASYYYGSTILCWTLILVMSIVIQSVTIIFDFASAFAVTALAFVFPALFYLRASRIFGGGTKGYERTCYFYFVLGVCNCILGCTSTVLAIIGDE